MGALQSCCACFAAAPAPDARGPDRARKASPSRTRAAEHQQQDPLAFGPDESYPLPDALDKAEAAQRLVFAAAEKEFAVLPFTESLANNVDPKWSRNGGAVIEATLATTGLIDANYLISLAQFGGALPRHEDVPVVAWLGAKQAWRLRSWSGFGSNSVLVISAPWLDPHHPDKHGATLRKVLPVLQALVATAKSFPAHEHATVGIMWDFCCVPQASADPQKRERCLLEHARCLAHAAVHVLLVTTPHSRGTYENRRPRAECGWAVYEEKLASLIKFDDCLWDLAKLDDAMAASAGGSLSYAVLYKALAYRRGPPVSPAELARALRSQRLHVQNAADIDVAIKMYERVFIETFEGYLTNFPGRSMLLCYRDRGWKDAEAAMLAEALGFAAEQCNFRRREHPLSMPSQATTSAPRQSS